MNEEYFKTYIDGVSHGEQGPAGIGVIISSPTGKREAAISEYIGAVNRNQAEFKAYLRALEELSQRNISQARIFSHSETLVRQIQGIYKIMDPAVKRMKKIAGEKFSKTKFMIELVTMADNIEAIRLAENGASKYSEKSKFDQPLLKMTGPLVAREKRENVSEAEQHSAGGVVFKKEEGGVKICLITKKKGAVWALPKGRVSEGETFEETAVREVREETGHLAEVNVKLDEIEYYFYWNENNTFYHKSVKFYLMPLKAENVGPRDHEAETVIWATPEEAYRKLTYLNEKEVLRKAVFHLERMS